MSVSRKYDSYTGEFRRTTQAIFAQMRMEDPILKQIGIDGETPIWFVTRYTEAQQILADDKHFVLDARLVLTREELAHVFGEIDPQIDRMMNNHMLN